MLVHTEWYKFLFAREGLLLTIMFLLWVMWIVMLFGLEPLVSKRMLTHMAKSVEKMR